MRVKFTKGKQQIFIKKVIENTQSPSLRALTQFGLDVSYSSLKKYYLELRLLPLQLFEDMCKISNLNKENFRVVLVDDNWGQVKGGKN